MRCLTAAACASLALFFVLTSVASASPRDRRAPSPPQNLLAGATTAGSIEVSWTASTDNVAVAGYDVSADGAARGTTSSTTDRLDALACGSTHSIGVTAFDAAGNRSPATTISAQTDPCAVSPPATTDFVSRVGQQLYLNGSPYRFIGFNLWRANVTSWNKPPNTGYLVNDGTTLADSLSGMKAGSGANVIRAWFFQQFANRGGTWDWSAFDKTLQVARAHGFKVIATLADQWSFEGPPFKDPAWYQGGYKTEVAAPYERVPYRQWVQTVVQRYASDPTILAWELLNEPDVALSQQQDGTCAPNAGAVLASFVADVGAVVKNIDHNHLLSLGVAGNGNCGTIESDYQKVMADPSLDLCSFHDYYDATNSSAYDAYNGLNVRVRQCGSLNKPLYIGEMGIHSGAPPCYGDLLCRRTYLGKKLSAAFTSQGMVGYLPWQYDQRGGSATSDDYVYGPGDPGLAVLGSYALP